MFDTSLDFFDTDFRFNFFSFHHTHNKFSFRDSRVFHLRRQSLRGNEGGYPTLILHILLYRFTESMSRQFCIILHFFSSQSNGLHENHSQECFHEQSFWRGLSTQQVSKYHRNETSYRSQYSQQNT